MSPLSVRAAEIKKGRMPKPAMRPEGKNLENTWLKK